MKKESLRLVVLTNGSYKDLRGYSHGVFQYGDLENGLEAYMIIELSDGKLVREPIEYIKFEN